MLDQDALYLAALRLTKNNCHQHQVCCKAGGRWSNQHFIAVGLLFGPTFFNLALFVNLNFYIYNQQQFRAGRAMNSSPAASPARCSSCGTTSQNFHHSFKDNTTRNEKTNIKITFYDYKTFLINYVDYFINTYYN